MGNPWVFFAVPIPMGFPVKKALDHPKQSN